MTNVKNNQVEIGLEKYNVVSFEDTYGLNGGSIGLMRQREDIKRVNVMYLDHYGDCALVTGYENVSNKPILLKEGYETTVNGKADDIAIRPGTVLFQTYSGNAHSFSSYRVWDKSPANLFDKVIQWCTDCGKPLAWYEWEYYKNHPCGWEVASEQRLTRHRSGECKYSSKYDTVMHCQHCHEEIGRWDLEYCTRNPTGLEIAQEQAREDHEASCYEYYKILWKEWRELSRAKGGETPRGLLNRMRKEDKWMDIALVPCPPDRYEHEWEKELEEFLEI